MLAAGTLKDRTAVVTGGGTGIGLAIARELSRLGANVVIASRKQEVLESAAEQLRATAAVGAQVACFPLDVRDPDRVEEVAAKVEERFGPATILVNNAAGNFVAPAIALSPNGWRAVVQIVLDGTFFCSQSFGRRMIDSGRGGSIVNIVATYAWTGGPGVVHSASAKAGVVAMTKTLAVEWAPGGVRVNAIAPGPIEDTGGADKLFAVPEIAEAVRKDVPVGRFGRTEEIAWCAAYLASDFSSYVNGSCFVVDGGYCLGKGFAREL